MMKYILCFDFGGSSIKCAVGQKNGSINNLSKFKTCDNLDDLLSKMKQYYESVKNIYDIEGISISSCGAVDPTTSIIKGVSAIPYIHNINWKQIIKEHFDLPLAIENDANCAALSELHYGNGSDVNDLLFLVIGTGIGGSIIINHKVHHGAHNFCGEFGMMLSKLNNQYINYSQQASTISMVNKISEKYPDINWNGELIFKKAIQEKDKECLQLIDAFFDNLALGIFNLIHCFDPEKVIIGGGISDRKDFIYYLTKAYNKLTTNLDYETLPLNVITCKNTSNANLIGAIANFYN